MADPTILMSSVTSALRAQTLLQQRGIPSCIRKIAGSHKLGGCGYGLELQGDCEDALCLLRAAGIRIMGTL